ncbi:hypothetical protein [Synechococcus sp. CS-1328]|uniref:hypothetical protein n=1 Tax=Synechococcus sp. CS-1328 TaxID=2847976 RepID=UPI00223A944C|nr:hypothetical protein [Synechococcus sp. CS-1328]MCT0226451.1 hypothetical protein [Synechococcus sp. CS-1328]
MLLEVQLVHAEVGARVVRAHAVAAGVPLGSALGEGATAEEAEDRARARLLAQIGPLAVAAAKPRPDPSALSGPVGPSLAPGRSRSDPAAPVRMPEPASLEASEPVEPESEPAAAPAGQSEPEAPLGPAGEPEPVAEPPPDPEDWSAELARLDLALQRLGWKREQESLYLERAFGHPSRSRLTTYADLIAYLRAVESLGMPCDPAVAPLPLRRRDLLSQCDGLLQLLGWDAQRGRRFLEEQFGRGSRQQLSDDELLRFNMQLESAMLEQAAT